MEAMGKCAQIASFAQASYKVKVSHAKPGKTQFEMMPHQYCCMLIYVGVTLSPKQLRGMSRLLLRETRSGEPKIMSLSKSFNSLFCLLLKFDSICLISKKQGYVRISTYINLFSFTTRRNQG